MRAKRALFGLGRAGLVLFLVVMEGRSLAATVNVTIGDDFFDPSGVAVNANDTVLWTWTGSGHSTTSDTAVWDSGVLSTPATFSFTFPNAGVFPYGCSTHGFMRGSVTVTATNQPPSVSITNPASGSTFAAPWTAALAVQAFDSDGFVTNVQFFSGATSIGNTTTPPYTSAVTGLGAGTYSFTAVATDNAGASTTSSVVNVSVVTPVVMMISSPLKLVAGQFRFTYTANPGLKYVVQKSGALPNFMGIATNIADSSSISFTDTAASVGVNLYRVGRMPNP